MLSSKDWIASAKNDLGLKRTSASLSFDFSNYKIGMGIFTSQVDSQTTWDIENKCLVQSLACGMTQEVILASFFFFFLDFIDVAILLNLL